MRNFVPDNYVAPAEFNTENFHLHPLTTLDNDLDYPAVTNSMAYRGGEDVESKSLTKERNQENLAWHEREFQEREAFVYTVLTPDKQKCLGCVYINPAMRGDFDAEIWMWVTVEAFEQGLDQKLYETVREWVSSCWPFNRVVYPGRSIDWMIWDELEK